MVEEKVSGNSRKPLCRPRVAAAEPIPHPRQCVCRNGSGRDNAWKLLWVRTRRAGFGMAYREGGSLEGEMHFARAGEIVLEELPDGAWAQAAAPGSFHSRSPHCARSRSV